MDKPCGEGILPQGIVALRALGVSLPPGSAFPFRGIQFADENCAARADFAGVTGLAVRRLRLHQILAEHAARAGVEFRWGARVTQIDSNTVATTQGRLSYDWLIGADGQNSQVRKWARLEPRTRRGKRFGFRRHFRVRPWSDAVEVHWAHGCQMFVTPIGRRAVGVIVFSRDPGLRIERALPRFPALAAKLRGAEPTSKELGDTTSLTVLPGVTRGRIALAGDASVTVDAVTGHGLSLAFQQALSLAEAIEQGDLSRYESAHKQIAAVPVTMSRLMRLMERSDWIRRRTLRLFQNSPGLFSKMLAIHTGARPLSSVGMAEIAGLGWKFLRA
jgi:2-polyprenyl-6-methoxyphenol hydroxylase-like FAD-dependent oxidoreductase